MTKYIFLDFDGVMHRNGHKAFEYAEYFAKVVAPMEDVKIVFSTSWREYKTVENLAAYLPKSIQSKCVGKTPLIRESTIYPRYKEIMMYTNEKGIADRDWVALDDMACLFPANHPNLILVDGSQGFTKKVAKILRQKLIYDPLKESQ
jgi:hypothetical protein